jgi:hypothetical protein
MLNIFVGKSVASFSGQLAKMAVSLSPSGMAEYQMVLDEPRVAMNELVGHSISLRHTGEILCQHCQRKTKKSYSGGFCFPCSQKLAQCDLCFMKPETCHYAAGTCREPEWGEAVCMQDHLVYLANSSGIKVGITRAGQIPTRWIDQGASQAVPIFKVSTRYQSGLIEVAFKNHVSDRTDWRKMLKGDPESLDLPQLRDQLFSACEAEISALQTEYGNDAIQLLPAEAVTEIRYPIEQYPSKVSSLNFDKTPEISGVLQGIKGQYLILDCGVLNLRKFTSYQIEMVV